MHPSRNTSIPRERSRAFSHRPAGWLPAAETDCNDKQQPAGVRREQVTGLLRRTERPCAGFGCTGASNRQWQFSQPNTRLWTENEEFSDAAVKAGGGQDLKPVWPATRASVCPGCFHRKGEVGTGGGEVVQSWLPGLSNILICRLALEEVSKYFQIKIFLFIA